MNGKIIQTVLLLAIILEKNKYKRQKLSGRSPFRLFKKRRKYMIAAITIESFTKLGIFLAVVLLLGVIAFFMGKRNGRR